MPVPYQMGQIDLAGAGDLRPAQLRVRPAGRRRQFKSPLSHRLAPALRARGVGQLAPLELGPGEQPPQVLHQDEMVGVAHGDQNALGNGAAPGAQRHRLRVRLALWRGPFRGQGKDLGRVAAGPGQLRLKHLAEKILHHGVLIADHQQHRLAVAHRQALWGLARPDHLRGSPAEGRAHVEAQGGPQAGQVFHRQLRRHGPQGMAGNGRPLAIHAPRQQAAQVPRRAGGPQARQGLAASLGLRA